MFRPSCWGSDFPIALIMKSSNINLLCLRTEYLDSDKKIFFPKETVE